MSCPCGSEESLEKCCQPYIDGDAFPPTPEKLMRSRYTAYTLGDVDYIVESHDPETRDEIDPSATRAWADEADWLGLEIMSTEGGGADENEGTVEFIARYEARERVRTHHERSVFKRRKGRWYFHDGKVIAQPSVVREGPKIGRNDPCPCGSGKKHKKCCGAAGKTAAS
jgi:SEC-C motif-containing protein